MRRWTTGCRFLLWAVVLILTIGFSTALLSGQTSAVPTNAESAVSPCWIFGTEIDLLPYVMNDYYASAFTAYDGLAVSRRDCAQ